ncbi:uncharacterized protein LOC129948541 [Eupeodes corollae]|uniref:uncharacterized protein LOC129948541 n=1 Tax=Eupeodes corollae TaxID=290404 RepID=UPI002490ECDF|nr:uncharacterized protein LOC129948541 [Eupeodes corollae]
MHTHVIFQNKPLVCDQGTLSPPSTRKVLEWLEKISNDLNSASSSRASTISRVSESREADLTSLLKTTIRGQLILAYYEKNANLDSKKQKDLTHCIVERFVGIGAKMSYRDMNLWANAIAETFPTENKDTYFLARKVGKKNPTGKLFSRWCNVERSADAEKKIDECELEQTLCLMVNIKMQKFTEKKCWLQHNCSPWDKVTQLWKETTLQRNLQFQSEEELSLTKLLQHWPRFNDANGFELIDIDFESLHPGKGSLMFTKYDSFISKIVLYFESEIKDKASKEMLKLLHKDEISKDSRDCIMSLLLHSVLQPTRLKKGYKPTIADAQSDFVVHVRSTNDLFPTLDKIKLSFLENKESLQPRVVVVGPELHDLKDFYVFCDGIRYKSCSFIKCLDIIIKLCSVYKIKYSQRSKLVWTFLEQYFFQIECETFSSVSNLVKKLS